MTKHFFSFANTFHFVEMLFSGYDRKKIMTDVWEWKHGDNYLILQPFKHDPDKVTPCANIELRYGTFSIATFRPMTKIQIINWCDQLGFFDHMPYRERVPFLHAMRTNDFVGFESNNIRVMSETRPLYLNECVPILDELLYHNGNFEKKQILKDKIRYRLHDVDVYIKDHLGLCNIELYIEHKHIVWICPRNAVQLITWIKDLVIPATLFIDAEDCIDMKNDVMDEAMKIIDNANKWDKLKEAISAFYQDENETESLGAIGEVAASHLGFLQ